MTIAETIISRHSAWDNVLRDSIFEQKTEEDLKDDYFDEPEEAL